MQGNANINIIQCFWAKISESYALIVTHLLRVFLTLSGARLWCWVHVDEAFGIVPRM